MSPATQVARWTVPGGDARWAGLGTVGGVTRDAAPAPRARLSLARETSPLPWDPARTWTHVHLSLDGRRLSGYVADLVPGRAADDWCGLGVTDLAATLLAPSPDGERTELATCPCTCPGCDPIWARLDARGDEVLWHDFAHGSMEDPLPGLAFTLDRAQVLGAIASLG